MKRHTPKGFTILEVLVASAILAMILVIMLQVINGIMRATLIQNQQMDSVASARRALDVMATDIEQGVVGNNAAILAPAAAGSATNLALLTSRGGPLGSSSHRFLAVAYSTNESNQIFRSYGSVTYNATAADLLDSAANATTTPTEPLAKGILRLSIRALADGANVYEISDSASANWATNSYNGLKPPSGFKAILTTTPSFASGLTNRTRALEVWIAAVDEQNLSILHKTSKLTVAQAALGTDPAVWRDQVDVADIPPQTKAAIRILKKTISTP